MISYIIGTVTEIREDGIVLENNGIGYSILVPTSFSSALSVGDEGRVHTYLNVREDALTLFGFQTKDDLDLFKLLLNVNGIGPKGALAVLSGMSADNLRFAVLADDAASISRIPGIGKKTAQKLILELKDRLDLQDAFDKKASHAAETQIAKGSPQSEAILALTALGYPSAQAMQAVRKAAADEENLSVEQILKKALKEL